MSKLYIIDDKSHTKTKVFMDYKTESHRHFLLLCPIINKSSIYEERYIKTKM